MAGGGEVGFPKADHPHFTKDPGAPSSRATPQPAEQGAKAVYLPYPRASSI